MKILFVFTIPSGGMDTLNRHRCKALSRNGHECQLLYFKSGNGLRNIEGITTYITENYDEINDILTQNNFDVIVVCSEVNFMRQLREVGYKKKLLFEVQGLGRIETAKHILFNAKCNQEHFDGVVCPETPHLQNLIKEFLPNKPLFSFPNCLDFSEMNYNSTVQKENSPIIGWVGRIEPNKNWSFFIKSFIEWKKQIPGLKGWLFEDHTLSALPERQSLNEMIDLNGLKHSIFFKQNVPYQKMNEYYSIIGESGGFLCSTSIYEGFGYAVAEAMACHCPVLSTDSDGVKALIKPDRTGKLVPKDDIAGFVRQGTSLMFNSEVRALLVKQASEHVYQYCNLETYAENFEKMIDRLIEATQNRDNL